MAARADAGGDRGDWSRTRCGRRCSIARRWRWASTRTTRSSSAGMAQKMQFLAEDVAAAREPTTRRAQELVRAGTARSSRSPAASSFRHLYFSPDRRGEPCARRCGERRSRSSPASLRMRSVAGVARRSVHVPGLLPRPRAGAARQGVRAAVRAGRREGRAGLVAGADRVRASAGTWCSSTR